MTITPTRSDYNIFYPVHTRWMDNDVYGHVNNVTYYSYFDTAANLFLIEKGGLDICSASVVAYVVNSGCNYLSPVAYPDILDVGFRVDRLGNASVKYGIAIFKKEDIQASAYGHLVHVFFDRSLNKSVPIPRNIRRELENIVTP